MGTKDQKRPEKTKRLRVTFRPGDPAIGDPQRHYKRRQNTSSAKRGSPSDPRPETRWPLLPQNAFYKGRGECVRRGARGADALSVRRTNAHIRAQVRTHFAPRRRLAPASRPLRTRGLPTGDHNRIRQLEAQPIPPAPLASLDDATTHPAPSRGSAG